MTTSTQWQLAQDAAERYEQVLVPPILGPFARALVDSAGLRMGEAVLDVGCGTGAAARFAAARVGPSGRVTGVDVNAGMIAVARATPSPEGGTPIGWQVASVYELEATDPPADVVLCAQTLQFLAEPKRALERLHRVLREGGRAAVSVWCPLEQSPYFHALVEAMRRHVGPDTAKGLAAAFPSEPEGALAAQVAAAGFRNAATEVVTLELPLPPLPEFIPRHIAATPMAAGYAAAPEAARAAVVEDVAARLAKAPGAASGRFVFQSFVVTASR